MHKKNYRQRWLGLLLLSRQRIQRGRRLDERAVDVHGPLVEQPRLAAELDRALKEVFEDLGAQSGAELGEDAMVRGRLVDVVTEEPVVAEVKPHLLGQPSLRGNAVEVADQQQLEEDDRVDRWLPGVAGERAAERPHEGEVDRRRDAAQQVVLGDQSFERELVIELGLESSLTHHGLPPWWQAGPISIMSAIRS